MHKPALLAAALLMSLSTAALARENVCIGGGFDCSAPLRWADRLDARDARIAITTVDGKVTLLLTDRVAAMQLSDRTMHRIDRKLHEARHERDEDDGALADAIRAAVISAVRSFLDHSAECPVSEIRDVRFDAGRLVLVSRDGDRLFDHLEIDDRDVLESFHASDAREFVREFRRLNVTGR